MMMNQVSQISREKEIAKRKLLQQYVTADLATISCDDNFDNDDDNDYEDLQNMDSFMDQKEDEKQYKQQQYLKTLQSLKFYEPSSELKAAQDKDFSEESLATIDNGIYCSYLKTNELTVDHVHNILHMLLTIEDLTCLMKYVPLTLRNASLTPCGVHSYTVNLENVNAENIIDPLMDDVILVPMASKLASLPAKDSFDYIMPHPHESVTNININRPKATVEEVFRDKVLFKFEKDKFPGLHRKLMNQRFDIIFRPQRRPLRYQYRALELLALDAALRNYIFPINNPNTTPPVYANLNLINQTIASNSEQFQAVQHIVEGPNDYAPYVIFGPPGTGKTTTIVEAILQLRLQRPRSRILVTAGSNAACDTIALRICQYFNSSPALKLHMAQRKKQPTIFNMDVAADHQIIRVYSKAGYMKSRNTMDPLLLAHSNCSGGEHYYMKNNAIREYGIIVATLCSVGALVTANVGKMNFFTHVFIDEAGASTEPETLVGIMGIKTNNVCRVVLSGDHKQLGPVLKSKRAKQLGLERSMLERLLNSPCYKLDENGNYDRTLQTRLRRNYRSHPEIVRLYNELYYNNELLAEALSDDVNMAAKWTRILPNPKFPIIFQATHGKSERKSLSPSLFNTLEVEQVLWYVRHILCDGNAHLSDIGIISPYRAQCKLISQTLANHMLFGIEVGSVEMFQGREKPIIIVSLVRSFTGLGFVNNPRRLNVILSRAKSLLILIGNPKTLSKNKNFRFIINECTHKDTFLYKIQERNIFNLVTTTTKSIRILKRPETLVGNTPILNQILNNNKKLILSLQEAFEKHDLMQAINCQRKDNKTKNQTRVEQVPMQVLLTESSNDLNTSEESLDTPKVVKRKEPNGIKLNILRKNEEIITCYCSSIEEEKTIKINPTSLCNRNEPITLKENLEKIIINKSDITDDTVPPAVVECGKIKDLCIEHGQIIETIEQNTFTINQQFDLKTNEVENLKILKVDANYNLKGTEDTDLLNIRDIILYYAQIIKDIQNKFTLSNETNNNSLTIAPPMRKTLNNNDSHISELLYFNNKRQKQQQEQLEENLENNPNIVNRSLSSSSSSSMTSNLNN